MYIKKVKIENVGPISELELNFPDNAAGWHVLIGDNGSGKSSILKAIAATLIGPNQVSALNIVWKEWLKKDTEKSEILLELQPDWDFDNIDKGKIPKGKSIVNKYSLETKGQHKFTFISNINQKSLPPSDYNWGDNDGWFSSAYGPFRRFSGGDEKRNKVFYSSPKAGAHLSLFGEDVALTEALEWLSDLDNKRLRRRKVFLDTPEVQEQIMEVQEQIMTMDRSKKTLDGLVRKFEDSDDKPKQEKKLISNFYGLALKETIGEKILEELNIDLEFEEGRILHSIKKFINNTGLLPNNAKFIGFDLDGNAEFTDDNNNKVNVYQMSDGYRSILSLTFELIRQLIRVYGEEKVFSNFNNENSFSIQLPGVVLIDEVDAHLHPTWQIKIGHWFIKYFPNLQFIITTHSPLVCRASEKGTIWRLGSANEDRLFSEVTGVEKDRLVFGNILDAYGTELFGSTPVRSEKSNEKLKRLGELNMLFALNQITKKEDIERVNLLKILPTDDPTGF